jgi:hypothetical protein
MMKLEDVTSLVMKWVVECGKESNEERSLLVKTIVNLCKEKDPLIQRAAIGMAFLSYYMTSLQCLDGGGDEIAEWFSNHKEEIEKGAKLQ